MFRFLFKSLNECMEDCISETNTLIDDIVNHASNYKRNMFMNDLVKYKKRFIRLIKRVEYDSSLSGSLRIRVRALTHVLQWSIESIEIYNKPLCDSYREMIIDYEKTYRNVTN